MQPLESRVVGAASDDPVSSQHYSTGKSGKQSVYEPVPDFCFAGADSTT